jgi:hypothetical protein
MKLTKSGRKNISLLLWIAVAVLVLAHVSIVLDFVVLLIVVIHFSFKAGRAYQKFTVAYRAAQKKSTATRRTTKA